MRRALCVTGVIAFAALAGAALWISETQATVQAGLEDLGFVVVEQSGGALGAPTVLCVEPRTLKHLRSLMKSGKTITVAADGRIEVKDAVSSQPDAGDNEVSPRNQAAN